MVNKKVKAKYKSVLLLDDNDLDNFINQKILEGTLFCNKVYVNTSSVSAIEFIKNLCTADKSLLPEVMFVDLNMPVMDGFQFIEGLIKQFPDVFETTKIVILTTSLDPVDQSKAKSISDKIIFLNKPLSEQSLHKI